MGYKFTVLFGIAILAAVQVYAEDDITYITENYDELSEEQLHSRIDDLINVLQRVAGKAAEYAQKGIEFTKNTLNDLAGEVQTKAKEELQRLEKDFRVEVDKLKEKAKHAGANIADCLEGNEDKLVNLPNQLRNDIVHCVSDNLNQAIFYTQDALNKSKILIDDIGNFKKEYEKCGTGVTSVICLAKIAAKLGVDITTIPVQIAADTAGTIAQISGLVPKVKNCATEKIDQGKNDGHKILEDIDVCVAKKIGKNQ